jgi:hypothetical protein
MFYCGASSRSTLELERGVSATLHSELLKSSYLFKHRSGPIFANRYPAGGWLTGRPTKSEKRHVCYTPPLRVGFIK